MITRTVRSLTGTSDPVGNSDSSGQGRVRAPEDVLRQARATSIAGVLGQIASVASHALDILQELKDETAGVQDRMTKLHQRVDVLAEVVDNRIRQHNGKKSEDLLHLLPSQAVSDRVLCIQTISASSSIGTSNNLNRPPSVVEAYERCERVPPLELLDSFYDTEQRDAAGNQLDNSEQGSRSHTSSVSRKKYSNPGFFMEEWLKNEEGRHQRTLEIKEERRRERQNLRKSSELDQQRQTTSTDDSKSTASTDDSEQKVKFLKIRSWKEIYGTGEGKELMKQPQSTVRSPSLRDLRKKAHQSLASIAQSPTREERQQTVSPPPPPPLPNSPDKSAHSHHQPLSSEQFSVSSPPDPPTNLGGAFMQEMDDDEIEMQLEDEFVNGIPPPPPPPDSTCPDEFTDHGLSYYYDPATSHNLPPPPPPPELDEQSKSDAYFDAYDEEDEDIPPPPPMEEFEQPPPPPSEPPSNFLAEIQLGKSLRRVKECEPQLDAPVQQTALLQQILQKQSRHLRPVEPRRPPLQTRQSPFADSIARILERSAVIAYDSDSDSHHSNNEDW